VVYLLGLLNMRHIAEFNDQYVICSQVFTIGVSNFSAWLAFT